MPLVDTSELISDQPAPPGLECDVCVIGTGPAGCTLARELSNSRLRVTVLESGGFERQEHADALNQIESIGHPRVMDQWRVRNRIVGGSSHTWTGRCAAFDDIDFEHRDWLPYSGWPFGLDHLAPFLERSAAYLGLGIGTGFSDDRFWQIARITPPQPALDASSLLPFFWQYTQDAANPYEYMRFGRHLIDAIGSNVTVVTNATALRVNVVSAGTAVESVDFAGVGGRRWTLGAKTIVLCAGAIENARLLLCSDNIQSQGLGNTHDQVGRFLMDHPRGTVARFELKDAGPLLKRFGLFKGTANVPNRFQAGLRLSPEVQKRERLLNCAGWIHEEITADDPWHALKRFLRGKAQLREDAVLLLRNADLLAKGLHSYFVARNGLPRKIEAISLDCMCEQTPNPASRLTLSVARDALGQRLPKLDWRISPEEPRAMRRLAELVIEQFPRLGLPAPVLEPWAQDGAMFPDHFEDIAHPTGTTRIAEDLRSGVVDASLKVHGLDGLYVAGSSSFPTAGHCNPTQMIVALALRLADKLKQAGHSSAVQSAFSGDVRPRQASGPLVLVTGASGRIGRHVLRQLTERGYAVRALTSKPVSSIESTSDPVRWHRHDFQESLEFDSVVADCAAVFHLGAELGKMERMARSNVDATRCLAEAAERAGVKAFIYTSSVAVYGLVGGRHVTEASPVLTMDCDIKNEYWAAQWLRAYGRTKLAGEAALRGAAGTVEYVIVRPTVVVDVPDLVALGDWGRVRKSLFANRRAHHVFMPDVADALIWLMERALGRDRPEPGVSTYILAEDETVVDTYKAFFDRAFIASGDPKFRVANVPWQVDWLRALAQARSLPLRPSFGRMRFSSDKLRGEGWQPRFGMDHAVARAVETIERQFKAIR